ncbi:MAG: hypothetical protein JO356_07970 [Acidobacteria bacterium]|nr:hypothetical protein [Acidobacteriota bacterium]
MARLLCNCRLFGWRFDRFAICGIYVDRQLPIAKDLERASSAFATPTIIHFGVVLLLSAVLSAPWQSAATAALVCSMMGIFGVLYTLMIVRRMRTQAAYKPEYDDWLFHVLLPLAAYAILASSACAARSHLSRALFGVGSSALLLLFVGFTMPGMPSPTIFFYQRRETPIPAGPLNRLLPCFY